MINMKKALFMVMSIVMALSLVCMSVSAATVSVDKVEYAENGDLLDVTVTYTAPETATQLTMLAATSDNVTDENISDVAVGIDQFARETGVVTKTFTMNKPAEGTTIYVRMGGTDAASANIGSVTYGTAAPSTGFTVSYYVTSTQSYLTENVENGASPKGVTAPTWDGYTFKGWSTDGSTVIELSTITVTSDMILYAVWEANSAPADYTLSENTGLGTRTLAGIANVSILRFTGLDATKVVTVGEGANAVEAKYYTTPAGEVVHVAVIDTTAVDKTKVSVADGTPAKIAIGNTNYDANNRINATDGTVLAKALAEGTLDTANLFKMFASDVDGNGRINASDGTTLAKAIADSEVSSMKGYTIK